MTHAVNMKLDDAALDAVQGGTGGYWDHSGKISMYVTPVAGNATMSTAQDRSSVRKNEQGVFVKWDRAQGREVPAPKLR
ncbi:hypothetical protein [Methylobacterium organophilum]|uniref:Uncharacterized protein n=1 Tax=Methylobacterium organophilum TaxID=410 RepID=A0ABQ4T911_METOR|nr:hypothetical protein [Methylobacterium organophilum]GJE27479.1 hypothetical protein LKMONMHP_2338 [Methylobacterium organophilum]